MKTLKSLLLLGFLLGVVTSCTPERAGGIDMAYVEFFDIPAGANPFETHYYEFNYIPTNANFYLTNPSEYAEVIPSYIRLTSQNGLQLDFIFNVYFQVLLDSGQYLEFAFRENVPNNTNTVLEVIPGLTNVAEQLTESSFSYRIRLEYRQIPTQNLEVRVDMGFKAYK